MRDKSFDLGRVCVLVEKLLDNDLFQDKYWLRPKDAVEWFVEQDDDKQTDVVHDIAYNIQSVQEQLFEISSICDGRDDLNDPGDR